MKQERLRMDYSVFRVYQSGVFQGSHCFSFTPRFLSAVELDRQDLVSRVLHAKQSRKNLTI